jgi:hypothetical protein
MSNEFNYAFLDSDNKIIGVVVFPSENTDIINQVKEQLNSVEYKSCKVYGQYAEAGGDFFEGKLYSAKPGNEWIRNTENGTWVPKELPKITSEISQEDLLKMILLDEQ